VNFTIPSLHLLGRSAALALFFVFAVPHASHARDDIPTEYTVCDVEYFMTRTKIHDFDECTTLSSSLYGMFNRVSIPEGGRTPSELIQEAILLESVANAISDIAQGGGFSNAVVDGLINQALELERQAAMLRDVVYCSAYGSCGEKLADQAEDYGFELEDQLPKQAQKRAERAAMALAVSLQTMESAR
jgi:hypothetical protein